MSERTGADEPVLDVQDLSVVFDTAGGEVQAVRGVSFTVGAGETVAVVGESGSGKSTTASAVNRLLADNARITSGRVLFEGRDLSTADERTMRGLRGAGIGLVPQDPMSNLDPMLRIGDQVAEALEVHGLPAGPDRVEELLEMVGIPDAAARARGYPHEFSGGMRQRVLIAIGLACRPRLVVADEPTSALDVTVQRRVLDELERLTGSLGVAVLLVTHDLALAAERADRVLVMHRGEVVESGTAAQILRRPQHDYSRRLLAAVPGLTAPVGRPEPPAAPPLLAVRGLVKHYPLRRPTDDGTRTVTAVDDVSLEIPRGATVSVVGESGSGKSTTANLVLGLERPDAGTITFDGQPRGTSRRELVAFRRRVQPVFQNPFASLDPRYDVGRSIAEPLAVHRVGTPRERRARVDELLEQVALPPEVARRFPHELSGGQRQRVAIVRALALRPDLVVLDEAVSALDVLVQQQILELLAGLQRELGLSYLFISHDLAVVRMISDVVHVMRRGRVVESGTPAQLFEDPQHDYTRELLASIPRPAA